VLCVLFFIVLRILYSVHLPDIILCSRNQPLTAVIFTLYPQTLTVSDFGVLIAIVSMVCLDAWFAVPTPKLSVPSEFKVITFNVIN
jgi:hypothetical protein